MQVKILSENGHDEALRGMAYSYKDRAIDPEEWWPQQREKAYRRAAILAHRDGGHNKFLRAVNVTLDVEACRAWWSEADTYKLGTVAQSESTMHTLSKRMPECDDFEEGTNPVIISAFQCVWIFAKDDINILKANLPEGYLQRRTLHTNYATLRNIISQRSAHRLRWWPVFCDEVLRQARNPEWLVEGWK